MQQKEFELSRYANRAPQEPAEEFAFTVPPNVPLLHSDSDDDMASEDVIVVHDDEASFGPGLSPTYRTYRRRWFGLIQLVLLTTLVMRILNLLSARAFRT